MALGDYVVFISHSSRDAWIARAMVFEIGAVWGQHKRVTPILNNVSYDAIAPLKGVNAVDLNDFDRFLAELGKRVRQRKHAGE